MRAIITRGLYILKIEHFKPNFKGQKRFLKAPFFKVMSSLIISIQEQVTMVHVRSTQYNCFREMRVF